MMKTVPERIAIAMYRVYGKRLEDFRPPDLDLWIKAFNEAEAGMVLDRDILYNWLLGIEHLLQPSLPPKKKTTKQKRLNRTKLW